MSHTQSNADKTLVWISRSMFLLLAAAGFSWLSSVGAQGQDNTREIALLKLQQVTPQVLVEMERRIMESIAANYTPVWLRTSVERLEKKVDEMGDKIDLLREKVIKLEAGK